MTFSRPSIFPAGSTRRAATVGASLLTALAASSVDASENVPHAPFAQWAETPKQGQFIVGLVYQESEAYHIWTKSQQRDVTWTANGEEYGIDINQGYISGQYGITRRWALDAAIGYTSAGWRYFSNYSGAGESQSTTGLMDFAFGVRYQVSREAEGGSGWRPTLTFRVGGALPGTFSEEFPFAPGTRSAAIEPEVIVRKHFGWPGLGFYGDALFRWNRTTHNDQYIVSTGLFQQIKGWEMDVGYRHLGTVNGEDIVLYPNRLIDYPRKVRENNDAVEAGFSYTTSNRAWQFGFVSRTVVDGSNSDAKFWIGGYVNFAFGGKDR